MCVLWCLQLASAAGVPVVLDAGGVDAPLDPHILPHITVLSPNETELSRLTGMPTETEEQVGHVDMCIILAQ